MLEAWQFVHGIRSGCRSVLSIVGNCGAAFFGWCRSNAAVVPQPCGPTRSTTWNRPIPLRRNFDILSFHWAIMFTRSREGFAAPRCQAGARYSDESAMSIKWAMPLYLWTPQQHAIVIQSRLSALASSPHS